MATTARGTLARALRLAVVPLTAAALWRALASRSADLASVHLTLDVGWLLVGVAVLLPVGLLLPLSWRATVGAFGRHLPAPTALQLWHRAQATRYLPIPGFAVGARADLARDVLPRRYGLASAVLEAAMGVSWRVLLLAVFASLGWLGRPGRVVLVAGAVVVVASLPTWVHVLSRATRSATHVEHLRRAQLLVGAAVVARSVGALCVFAALGLWRSDQLPLLVTAVNLSFLAGLVGLTPAGVGVREGVLASMIAGPFGAGSALGAAVVLRLCDVVVDLAWLVPVAVAWRGRARPSARR